MGSFGYKIGRKLRLMRVQFDADLLWQTCVREIYLLMKHYGSVDKLREAFENLKEAKGNPKASAIEKCAPYKDLTASEKINDDWSSLTRNCQHSFINILDTGYFLNNGEKTCLILLLDFNTNTVKYYHQEKIYETATIDEIMNFEDMPTKPMTEIVLEMKERYLNYNYNLKKIDEEIIKIQLVIDKAKEMGDEQNIIQKANNLLNDVKWKRKSLELKYRYFYHRLDALNLIEH
jgi:hypothetical protein